jgi:hypothetical protein
MPSKYAKKFLKGDTSIEKERSSSLSSKCVRGKKKHSTLNSREVFLTFKKILPYVRRLVGPHDKVNYRTHQVHRWQGRTYLIAIARNAHVPCLNT